MSSHMKREVCESCSKQIYIGQRVAICEQCDIIVHKKCASKINKSFLMFREKLYCASCIAKNDIIRYNPFINIVNDNDPGSLHGDFCDNSDVIETSQIISDILENCHQFNSDTFNEYVKSQKINNSTHFTTYFYNIDGNKSNFDQFSVELSRIEHKFSVIGIAETNTSPENKNLYQIPNYTSCYQKTLDGKKKGTGVALYINHNTILMFAKITQKVRNISKHCL